MPPFPGPHEVSAARDTGWGLQGVLWSLLLPTFHKGKIFCAKWRAVPVSYCSNLRGGRRDDGATSRSRFMEPLCHGETLSSLPVTSRPSAFSNLKKCRSWGCPLARRVRSELLHWIVHASVMLYNDWVFFSFTWFGKYYQQKPGGEGGI